MKVLISPTLLLFFCISVGNPALATTHTVCNNGNVDVKAVVVNRGVPGLFSRPDAVVSGWYLIKKGRCTELHRQPDHVRGDIAIGFAHAGSNSTFGVGIYKPRSRGNISMEEKEYCVDTYNKFSLKRSHPRKLAKNCPDGYELMPFSYRNVYEGVNNRITIAPDKNLPVLPFLSSAKPGTAQNSAAKPKKPEPKKPESSKPYIRRSETGGPELSEVENNTAGVTPLECQEVKAIVRDAKNRFSRYKPKVREKTSSYREYLSRFKLSGYRNACTIAEIYSKGDYFGGNVTCKLESASGLTALATRHKGLDQSLAQCLGVEAKNVRRTVQTTYETRIELDGKGLYVEMLSFKDYKGTLIRFAYFPKKCATAGKCNIPE